MAEPEFELAYTDPRPESLTTIENESGLGVWREIWLEGKPRTDLGGL